MAVVSECNGDVKTNDLEDNKIMRYEILLLLISVAVLSGCSGGTRKTYVKPSISSLPVQDGQALGSAKYSFPANMGAGRFEVYYQGYGVRKVSNSWPQPSLRIQVSCENDSDNVVIVDTTESHIIDNRGDVLRCSGAKRDGAPADSFEEVRPHSHAQFDLFYDLRKNYALSKVENFKVYWRYKGGQQSVANSTMFVRQRVADMLYRDRAGKTRQHDYFMAVQDVVPGKVGQK